MVAPPYLYLPRITKCPYKMTFRIFFLNFGCKSTIIFSRSPWLREKILSNFRSKLRKNLAKAFRNSRYLENNRISCGCFWYSAPPSLRAATAGPRNNGEWGAVGNCSLGGYPPLCHSRASGNPALFRYGSLLWIPDPAGRE